MIGPQIGAATRTRDQMSIGLAAYSDADGHAGGSVLDEGSLRLYRNGRLIGSLAPHCRTRGESWCG